MMTDELDTREWVANLQITHPKRVLIGDQVNRFYSKRRMVEYGIKATVIASLSVALLWGGPPILILGGAAVILKLTSLILNRFNPSQFIEVPKIQGIVTINDVDNDRLETYRRKWQQQNQQHLFNQHIKDVTLLQKKIMLALVMGFVIFSAFNATLTIPIIIASMCFIAALIEHAKEDARAYVEPETQLEMNP